MHAFYKTVMLYPPINETRVGCKAIFHWVNNCKNYFLQTCSAQCSMNFLTEVARPFVACAKRFSSGKQELLQGLQTKVASSENSSRVVAWEGENNSEAFEITRGKIAKPIQSPNLRLFCYGFPRQHCWAYWFDPSWRLCKKMVIIEGIKTILFNSARWWEVATFIVLFK